MIAHSQRGRSREPLGRAFYLTAGALLPLCLGLAALPRIGHDYIYFLPRLLDTQAHMLVNGMGVQRWTPTFGGGVPAMANPQSMQYSLPQAMAFVLDPYLASLLGASVFLLLGCFALYRLGRRTLDLGQENALLLGLVFGVNGFTFSHMLSGHLSYHAFPLQAVLLWVLLDRSVSVPLATGISGLCAAYYVHSGGYFVSVAAVPALLCAYALACAARPTLFSISRLLAVGLGGLLLGLGLSVAKLEPMLALMKQFPRSVASEPMESFFVPLLQLMFYPIWLARQWILGEIEPLSFVEAWFYAKGPGAWELDCSMNPLFILVLVLLSVWLFATRRRPSSEATTTRNTVRGAWAAAALLAGLLALSLASARGPLFELLKSHWPLSSLHVNSRFTSSLMLPLSLAGCMVLERFRRRIHPRGGNLVISVLLLSTLAFGLLYLPAVRSQPMLYGLTYDVRPLSRALRALERFPPVGRAALVYDDAALALGRSSLLLYEPLFAYNPLRYRRLTPVRSGPADLVESSERGPVFNLHFPPAFEYPEFYGAPPFSRIPANQVDEMERFRRRMAPGWPIPQRRKIAEGVSLACLLLVLVLLGLAWWRRGDKASREGRG